MRRGFTLIEMMLTVALMALVLAMIGGILLSVIAARDAVEEMTTDEKAGYGILATIRKDLTGLYAYGMGGPAFKGQDREVDGYPGDTLHFVTTADVGDADESGVKPRLVEVGYRVKEADEGNVRLLYRRATGYQGDPLKGGGSYSAIYQNLRSFNLEYLDPEDNQWKESWDAPDRLPKAVKVKIELAKEGEEELAAEEQRETRYPAFETVIGIPAATEPAENTKAEEEEGGEGAAGAGGAGAQPPPGG